MTTINVETKYTAPEPCHAAKLVAKGSPSGWECKPSDTDPLVYVTGRGWTWSGSPSYFTWDEYVKAHHSHFPLEEKKRRATVTGSDTLSLEDSAGDKLKVRFSAMSNRVEVGVIEGIGNTSTMVYLRDEDLLELRDKLNRLVAERNG